MKCYNPQTWKRYKDTKRSPTAVMVSSLLVLAPLLGLILFWPTTSSRGELDGMTLEPAMAVEEEAVTPEIIEEPRHTLYATLTAYSSTVWQTDDTPCTSASGMNICHLFHDDEMSICAANFVPLGTVLEVEGVGECVVFDRMHSRHTDRVDIYMGLGQEAYENAVQFGIKHNKLVTWEYDQ